MSGVPMIPTERDLDVERAYRLGCIVGAAIVAWGDAMRARPGMTAWRCLVCDTCNPEGSTVCDDCGAEWT